MVFLPELPTGLLVIGVISTHEDVLGTHPIHRRQRWLRSKEGIASWRVVINETAPSSCCQSFGPFLSFHGVGIVATEILYHARAWAGILPLLDFLAGRVFGMRCVYPGHHQAVGTGARGILNH